MKLKDLVFPIEFGNSSSPFWRSPFGQPQGAKVPFRFARPSYGLTILFWLLVCPFTLMACNSVGNSIQPSTSTSTSTSTSDNKPLATDRTTDPDSRPSPKPIGKTYKEPSGAFEISFPKGYQYEETGSGIKFVASHEGFKGFVDFAETEQALDADKLEGALRQYLEGVLKEVEWQNSNLEADGKIRVDWIGKSANGERLDAISYIEQQGNTIFTLSLYGVDKAFDDHSGDAETILGNYKVRQAEDRE